MTNLAKVALLALLSILHVESFSQGPTQQSDSATVTFYSSGPTIVSGRPGGLGAFMGKIYIDGQEFGRLGRHTFITFKLTSGPHEFALSSWMGRSPDRHADLPIKLEPNGQYFISTNFTGGPGGQGGLLIREVTCEAASTDNVAAKPLGRKNLTPDGALVALSRDTIPQCE